jgi:hypothetical protein
MKFIQIMCKRFAEEKVQISNLGRRGHGKQGFSAYFRRGGEVKIPEMVVQIHTN